jgi:LysR family glycine cleavage system transcriptional activator
MGTLAVFESAGRLLSFSRAADECALSQASVSRQMRQLEENLSVQLFDRHRHDVTLTEAGARFHETVVRSLTSLSSIASELRSHSQRDTRFTIYSDLSLATHVLTPVIEHLQERFPEIAFIIHSSYEPVEQTDISFDLGLQPGARTTTELEQKTIGEDLMFPVCSPAFLENCKQNFSVTELCQLPLLQVDYENKGGVDWDNFLSQFDMTLSAKRSDLIFSSYQVCLSVAEQGHGVALGWARSVNHKLAEGKLVRISNLSAVVPDGVVVYRKKYGEAHPITNDVMQIIE